MSWKMQPETIQLRARLCAMMDTISTALMTESAVPDSTTEEIGTNAVRLAHRHAALKLAVAEIDRIAKHEESDGTTDRP